MSSFDPATAGNGHFLKVPTWLLRIAELSAADVLTMAALIDYARIHDECAPRVRELGAVLRKDARNVQRSLDRLEAFRLIRSQPRNGRPNLIEFLPHPAATGGEVATPGGGEVAVGTDGNTGGEVATGTPGEVAVGGVAKLPGEGRHSRHPVLREKRDQERDQKEKRLDQALSDPRVQEIAEHYRTRLQPGAGWKVEAKVGRKPRAVHVLAALERGESVERLKLAIDAIAASDWHRDNGFTDLELAVRDGMVDKHIARGRNARPLAKRSGAPVSDNYDTSVDDFGGIA